MPADCQDYGALFIPNIPFITKQQRELPFYGVEERLPYLLVFILGLQHALAMVGGLVTPPLLLAGPAGAALLKQDRSFSTDFYIGAVAKFD